MGSSANLQKLKTYRPMSHPHKRGRSDRGPFDGEPFDMKAILEACFKNESKLTDTEVDYFHKRLTEGEQAALLTSSNDDGIIGEDSLLEKVTGRSVKTLAKCLEMVVKVRAERSEDEPLVVYGCDTAQKVQLGIDDDKRKLAAIGKKHELGRKLIGRNIGIRREKLAVLQQELNRLEGIETKGNNLWTYAGLAGGNLETQVAQATTVLKAKEINASYGSDRWNHIKAMMKENFNLDHFDTNFLTKFGVEKAPEYDNNTLDGDSVLGKLFDLSLDRETMSLGDSDAMSSSKAPAQLALKSVEEEAGSKKE